MQKPVFEINVLPAAEGDCIHLRFQSLGKWYNIVIDSGPPSDQAEDTEYNFSALMARIKKRGEHVDLLCFSHIDDDHIKAAEAFLGKEEGAGELIRQIWLNIPAWEVEKATPQKPSMYCTASADAAISLYEYILGQEIPCETRVLRGMKEKCGDVEIVVVLPFKKRLESFEKWWIEKRPQLGNFVQTGATDSSPTNGASITLLVSGHGRKMLFSGDAFASDLRMAAEAHAGDGFDLIKLSHHGSARNITRIMLEKMKCKHYFVSADGSENRPAQAAVDLLGQYGENSGGVTLYGNYEWDRIEPVNGVTIIPLTDEAIPICQETVTIRSER